MLNISKQRFSQMFYEQRTIMNEYILGADNQVNTAL